MSAPAASSADVATTSLASEETTETVPCYIPLPDALYQLRRTYPSVLERVLLECTRCRQWCAVEVLPNMPDVVTHATPVSAQYAQVVATHLRHNVQDNARKRYEASQSGTEWHSPRLRSSSAAIENNINNNNNSGTTQRMNHHADDTVAEHSLRASILEQVSVAHAKRRESVQPPPPRLYIPNPAAFTCQSRNCQLGDVLVDLRQEWVGTLYNHYASEEAKKQKKTTSASKSKATSAEENSSVSNPSAVDVREEILKRRDALNEALSRELDLRRSGRLACRRDESGDSPTCGSPNHSGGDDILSSNPSRSYGVVGWLQAAATHLSHDEEATLTAFCWINCERCGKLRRVAQPFPGGAPFVCALSASVGTCDVGELEGIESYTQAFAENELRRAALACPFLPFPLRKQAAAMKLGGGGPRSGCSSPVSQSREDGGSEVGFSPSSCVLFDDPLLKLIRTEAARAFANGGKRVGQQRSASTTPSSRSSSPRLQPASGGALSAESLPLLKQLVAQSRKRLMGAFVKHVMLTPQEIRRKREEVFRQAFLSGEDLAHITSAAATATAPATAATISPAVATAAQAVSQAVVAPTTEDNALSTRPRRRRRTPPLPTAAAPVNDAPLAGPVSGPARGNTAHVVPVSRGGGGVEPPSVLSLPIAAPAIPQPGEADAPMKRKRGRPRKDEAPVSAAPPSGTEQPVKKADEVVHWVQCDRCEKWRIVPQRIPKSVTFWECRMRVDGSTTCNDPSDD